MSTSSQPGSRHGRERRAMVIPVGLCRRCVRRLSRLLRDLPGVVSFEVDSANGRVWIDGGVDPAEADAVVRGISCS